MADDMGDAVRAAAETLNGASATAGQAGPRAGFVQVELSESDRAPIVEDRMLDLAESEAWLIDRVNSGFVGVLSFCCVSGGDHDRNRLMIAQAIDTRNGARVQMSVSMRRTITGKLKAINGNAEVEVLDKGTS